MQFTPTANGNYAVMVTKDCTDTSSCKAVTAIGIKENSQNNSINFYPNPNNGNFVVETTEKGKIEIVNTLGQMIYNKAINPGKNNIELENTGSGFYLVSFLDEEGNRSAHRMVVR